MSRLRDHDNPDLPRNRECHTATNDAADAGKASINSIKRSSRFDNYPKGDKQVLFPVTQQALLLAAPVTLGLAGALVVVLFAFSGRDL